MDRQILRGKAKKEFKELQKNPQNRRVTFQQFFKLYRAAQKLKALSGAIKNSAEEISVEDRALLESILTGAEPEVIEAEFKELAP